MRTVTVHVKAVRDNGRIDRYTKDIEVSTKDQGYREYREIRRQLMSRDSRVVGKGAKRLSEWKVKYDWEIDNLGCTEPYRAESASSEAE